jgi:hypothetical protein
VDSVWWVWGLLGPREVSFLDIMFDVCLYDVLALERCRERYFGPFICISSIRLALDVC